jgi:methionine synthase I (cobalamin-dependent)
MSGLFTEMLAEGRVLIADGGMGTLLLERGLGPGESPELLNVEQPEIVAGIHREYISAGADIILTNSFGGTAPRLAHFDLEDRVAELNAAAVAVAREAADAAGRQVAVAGSMGPTGELFAPFGPLEPERAFAVFREQAEALAKAGVDVLWIETMSALDEVEAAFKAATETGLPVVTTMSFDTHGRTMMGLAPVKLVEWASHQTVAPAAIGANCGVGPDDVVAAVAAMAPQGIPTIAKANCGLPKFVDGALSYPLQPPDMPDYAAAALAAGARIVGACCGSTPEHIAAVRASVT